MEYEELLQECHNNGALVIEKKRMKSNAKGLINGNRIALRDDIPTLRERKCVLAEELGHFKLTVGNILNCRDENNCKQEHKARDYAYAKLITLGQLVDAYEEGCHTMYEIAEYLDVTEDFFKNSIDYHKRKSGQYVIYKNYIIYFVPYLGVMKLFGKE